jgi:hypothetical protein
MKRTRRYGPAVLSVLLSVVVFPGLSIQSSQAQDSISVLAALPDKYDETGFYRPSQRGFQYKNSEFSRHMSQMPLYGGYSPGDYNPDWEEYKLEAMTFMFDPDEVCLGNSGPDTDGDNPCMLTATANRWIENQFRSIDQGACEGMVVSSLVLWQLLQGQLHDSELMQIFYDDYLNFAVPDEFESDVPYIYNEYIQQYASLLTQTAASDMQNLALYIYVSQFTEDVIESTEQWRYQAPLQIFTAIRDSIHYYQTNMSGELFTVGMYQVEKGTLTKGHSLLPYKVVSVNDQVAAVFVYDPNYPARDDLYIQFNADNTWSYQPDATVPAFMGNASSGNLELSALSSRNFLSEEHFDCPFCPVPNPADAPIEVYLSAQGMMQITNSEGNIAGFDFDTESYVNQFKAAAAPFKGGLGQDVPNAYVLPPDRDGYAIIVFNPEADYGETTDLIIETAGVTIVLEGLPVTGEDILVVTVKNTADGPFLEISGFESTLDIPMIYLAVDEQEASYEFGLSDVRVTTGAAMEIGISRSERALLFGRGWSAAGEEEYREVHNFAANRFDETGNYWLELPEIVASNQETVVFMHGLWEPNYYGEEMEILAEDVPMEIFEADIEALLDSSEESRRSLTSRRPAKNGTGKPVLRQRGQQSDGG